MGLNSKAAGRPLSNGLCGHMATCVDSPNDERTKIRLSSGNQRGSGSWTRTNEQSVTAEGDVSDSDRLQPIALGSPEVLHSASKHARHLLLEVAAGRWNLMLAIRLATAVMNDPVNRLAIEILTLGPHTVERTIELAKALARAVALNVIEKARSGD